MRLIAAIRQRIIDWRLERSINGWRELAKRAMANDCRSVARAAYEQMGKECAKRSPQQIARMEARIRG
jgi:hypothetical protein